MITNDMMIHKMFVRCSETHTVTMISYLSKTSSLKIVSTFENPLTVKIEKFKSIERFIIVVNQKNIMKVAFGILSPIKFISAEYDASFLLETTDGELKITFRDS